MSLDGAPFFSLADAEMMSLEVVFYVHVFLKDIQQ